MSVELGQALKEARKRRKLSAAVVGAHVGISPPAVYQWEAGRTEPGTENLVRVAELLGIDPWAARRGEIVDQGELPASRAMNRSDLEPDVVLPRVGEELPAPPIAGNRDVEVRGISVGGLADDADFSFNGQVVDYVARPAGIARRKDIFVVYAVNDSMYPAIRPGDPLFIDPHRPPQIGDDVIVEMASETDEPGCAYIKRLVRRSGSKIVVEQFNPPKEITFDRGDVRTLYRVTPVAELVS